MQSNQTRITIEDTVMRPRKACWFMTVDGAFIDLTRFAKIEIVADLDEDAPEMYSVAAFPDPCDLDNFEVLYEAEFYSAAQEFFKEVMFQLIQPSTVH